MRGKSFISLGIGALVACSSGSSTDGGDTACSNGPCPSGHACRNLSDCPSGAGFSCTHGVCARSCRDGGGCAPGETCGDVDDRQSCLRPCAAGCDGDGGCQTYWPTHTSVCGTKPFVGACASVTAEAMCATCNLMQYTEPCDDSFCPAGASCQPFNPLEFACVCGNGGSNVDCSGRLCADPATPECIGGNWACQNTFVPPGVCLQEQPSSAGHCVCADGRTLPYICGETNSCEQRCSQGCDILAQDCVDSATPKCTGVEDAGIIDDPLAVQRPRVQCVPQAGTLGEGMPCTFTTVGDDECAKGLLCTTASGIAGGGVCRALCKITADCAPSHICARVLVMLPPLGACLPTCSIHGTECGAGFSCTWAEDTTVTPATYCKSDGAKALGDTCVSNHECGANLACREGTCRAMCSSTVACDAGTCELQDFQDHAFGSCF